MQRLTRVRVDSLRFDNIRTVFDIEELKTLGASLLTRQNHPILIRTNQTVIDGQRRGMAARLVGIEELDAIETDEELTQSQILDIQFTSAFHRADLTPYEKWRALETIKLHNPGWNGKELAEHLHIDPGQVTRLLSPGKCIPAVQEALKDGKLTISDVYAISKASHPAQELLLVKALSGATREVLESARKRPASDTVKLPKIKIPLSNDQVSGTVTVAGEDIDLDGAESILKEALKAIKFARDKNFDVKTAQAAWRSMASA